MLFAWAPLPGNGPPAWQAFPLDGGRPIPIPTDYFISSPGGAVLSIGSAIIAQGRSYLIPAEAIARIPPGGLHSEEEIARLPGARRIDAKPVFPGASPDVYAFFRGTVQRNLYRIPIP